jgi:hypothetical protein
MGPSIPRNPFPTPALSKIIYVEKIIFSYFGQEVGKSVILCQFIQKMTQFPVNDCFPW